MQVIKLVELNSVELEDRIKQEVEDNPALETVDHSDTNADDEYDFQNDNDKAEEDPVSQEDILLGDYFSEDDIPDYHPSFSSSGESRQRDFVYSDEKRSTNLCWSKSICIILTSDKRSLPNTSSAISTRTVICNAT